MHLENNFFPVTFFKSQIRAKDNIQYIRSTPVGAINYLKTHPSIGNPDPHMSKLSKTISENVLKNI